MNDQKRTVLVATHNRGKVSEYEELMAGLHVSWVGLGDVGIGSDVDETGATFEENAILKAQAYARASGLLTLADDSGLEVDALDGRPGVHTARYGGVGLDSAQRYRLLLEQLAAVPMAARRARFRCVVALAQGEQLWGTASGVVEGQIAFEPAGKGGFGYDPVFYLPQYERTMAQLPAAVKNQISHRARALQALLPLLRSALAQAP